MSRLPPADRPGPLDTLIRGRRVSPRRRLLGTLSFAALLLLAFMLAPRPDLRVVNASSETLRDLQVCLGERCESRPALDAGTHWNVPLRVTQDATATLTLAGAPGGTPTQGYVTPGQRLDFQVRGPGAVEVITR